MKTDPNISISIVSHNQGILISKLLADLQRHCAEDIEVILTLNTYETLPFRESDFSYPLYIIKNKAKKGFGTNHNQAFRHAKGAFFCVLNPDIRLDADPFPTLLACFRDGQVGVAAPLVKDENGKTTENARKYPTFLILLKKLLNLKKTNDYPIGLDTFSPDWVGGMFMLFPYEVFRRIQGFDERYFLYYEDVDLCARLKLNGYKIIHNPFVTAIHEAQHDSHRNIRYLTWHVLSILHFFSSRAYINVVIKKSAHIRKLYGGEKNNKKETGIINNAQHSQSLKILIVTQYFWPENFRINDLVLGLQENGHEVKVLTGIPNYPAGSFFDGYSLTKPLYETFNGIPVFRVPLFPRGSGSRTRLVLNYLAFVFSTCLIAPFRRLGPIDLIFIYEPSPITVCLPALLLKKLKSAPVMFWMQDLWPESLSATGAVRSKTILKLVDLMVRYIYRGCDRILVQSRAFIEPVKRQDADPNRVLYFPNSAENLYKPVRIAKDASKRALIPEGFCVTFAGNIGAAQDFGTILSAAEHLRGQADINWVVIGDGRMFTWLQSQVSKRNLTNTVHLLGRYPAEAMPGFFALSDALLVTLKKEPIFSLTIPSKVQSYLACARPIIAALEGEGARVIEEADAGLTCRPEDPQALAKIVLELYKQTKSEREKMGRNGCSYFEKHFEREMLLGRLQGWMKALAP